MGPGGSTASAEQRDESKQVGGSLTANIIEMIISLNETEMPYDFPWFNYFNSLFFTSDLERGNLIPSLPDPSG